MLVNVIAILIAWPFAKQLLKIVGMNKNILIATIITIVILLNLYVGILDYRAGPYMIYLLLFSVCGIMFRNTETVPLIFMFILGNEIEGVFYRQFLI